jgi:sigma-B regulation protein RsbU (phosphoserine phosphatase)
MAKADKEKADKADIKDKKPEISPVKSGVKFSLRWKFSLAIIGLTVTVILTLAGFIFFRESDLLRRQVIDSINREVIHLNNTTQQVMGSDDLAILAAIEDLKKINYIKYAYVLNPDGSVIQFFDRRDKKFNTGDKFDDGVARTSGKVDDKGITTINYPDPNDKAGIIFDFSKTVLNKVNVKVAIVVIGLSDIIIREELQNLVKVIVPLSLIFIGISILGAIVLASVTIKPIRILSQGASIIGQGNLDYRIEIKSTDELGALAREFNEMTSQIKDSKENEIEQRLMQEQLDVARDIQEGLNPMGFYNKGGIQIKGFTRAAKGVGGDYFDYREIGDHKIGALLSDVAGKGVPASLVMVMIRTVFTALISRGDVDCGKLVRSINDSMSGDFAIDKFATLFFFVYDKLTGEVSFANAGHGPLFLYRAALNACTVTQIGGVPIGIMEDIDYSQAKVKLNPGDIILVNSDGITEMRNVNKDEYGHQRLQQMFIDNSGKNANDIVETIVNDVEAFRGEASPHDDMTILVFKRES